jgi:CheY-like chemotaxis protein
MRILAVDDEPIFCEFLHVSMKRLGYVDIDFAFSGKEALARIKATAQPYDCFLLDIRMLPMDGIELVERIRENPKHTKTPIIMISALSDKGSIDRAFMAGANDYVTKPLDPVELKIRLSMVKGMLEARAQMQMLDTHILEGQQSKYARLNFEDDFTLDDVSGLTTVAAIENYLLKLGNLRLRSCSSIGFHVPVGQALFKENDHVCFTDIMAEVALVISRSLRSYDHVLAYAGSANFIALAPQTADIDQQLLQKSINVELAAMAQDFWDAGVTLPNISVGEPVTAPFLSFGCPTHLIGDALQAAINRSSGGIRHPRRHVA